MCIKSENSFQEISTYLSSIDKLDSKEYSKLIAVYGTELVHSVIDKIIDCSREMRICNIDYYIDMLMMDVDKFSDRSILDIYMQDIGRTPRLTPEENAVYADEAYYIVNEMNAIFKKFECKYTKKVGVVYNSILDEAEFYLKECTDINLLNRIKVLYDRFIFIRDKLVNGNIRVVVAASRSYFRDINSFIDMIQCGNLGLMRAVEKYNPNFNTRFVTYAYYWIRQAIRSASKMEFSGSMSVSYNAIEKNDARKKAINILTNQLGRKPTDEEVASYMGISDKRLEEIRDAFQESISLYSKISNDDSETALIDMFKDTSVNIENEVCTKMLRIDLFKIIEENLNSIEKVILLNRFGFLGDIKTFQELGDIYGFTKQYINQTQNRALVKIRRLAGEKLRGYL